MSEMPPRCIRCRRFMDTHQLVCDRCRARAKPTIEEALSHCYGEHEEGSWMVYDGSSRHPQYATSWGPLKTRQAAAEFMAKVGGNKYAVNITDHPNWPRQLALWPERRAA